MNWTKSLIDKSKIKQSNEETKENLKKVLAFAALSLGIIQVGK